MSQSNNPADREAVGENPYTDPPPMARRRFYEDPRPSNEATEEQIRQGRGERPPYPADQPPERAWRPERYPEQKAMKRPPDSPQPSEAEANDLTVAQLLRMPREQQEKILQDMRALLEDPARRYQNPQQGSGGVQQMAPASPGTVLAGEGPEEEEEEEEAEEEAEAHEEAPEPKHGEA